MEIRISIGTEICVSIGTGRYMYAYQSEHGETMTIVKVACLLGTYTMYIYSVSIGTRRYNDYS